MNRRQILTEISFAVFTLVAAHFVLILRTPLIDNKVAGIARLVLGIGNAPFQYRALTYWLLYSISNFIPTLQQLRLALQVLDFCAIVILFYVVRYYLSLFYEEKSIIYSFLLFPMLAINYGLIFNMPYAYPFDIPALIFFVLGLAFMYQDRWIPFYLIFVIGTLNRETMILLTFIMFLAALDRRKVIGHCIAQVIIWGLIKLNLCWLYSGCGGLASLVLENRSLISQNLDYLADPSKWYLIFSSMSFLWIPVLLYWRRIRVQFLRQALLVLIPYVLIMFAVGIIYELRIWGEMIAVVLPAYISICRGV